MSFISPNPIPRLTEINSSVLSGLDQKVVLLQNETVPSSDTFSTGIIEIDRRNNKVVEFYLRADDGRMTITVELHRGTSPTPTKTIEIAPFAAGASNLNLTSYYTFKVDVEHFYLMNFIFEHPDGSSKDIFEFGYIIKSKPEKIQKSTLEPVPIQLKPEPYPVGYVGVVATLAVMQEWMIRIRGEAISSDKDGNIYFGHSSNCRKADRFGNLIWDTDEFSSGLIRDMECDLNNNVIIGAGNLLIKLSTDGVVLFVITNWPGDIRGVSTDSQGNIYAASLDGDIRKADPDGNIEWTNSEHSSGVYSIAAYRDGTTVSGNNSGNVKKISPDGETVIWTYDGSGRARDIDIDENGDVFVVTNQVLRKINGITGDQLWSRSIGETINGLATDNIGSVYIADDEGRVLKYNADTGDRIYTVTAHSDEIRKITSTIDGGVVTAARDSITRKIKPEMQIIGYRNVT